MNSIRFTATLHLPFNELTADPTGIIRKIYEQRGRTFSAAFEDGLRAWLSDPENRTDCYGRHPYSYEAFGFDRDWIQELFAGYSRSFGLEG